MKFHSIFFAGIYLKVRLNFFAGTKKSHPKLNMQQTAVGRTENGDCEPRFIGRGLDKDFHYLLFIIYYSRFMQK